MISYYAQEKEYTCGPAVMRMVLSSYAHKIKEKVPYRPMGTTKRNGTPESSFSTIARAWNIQFHECKKQGTLPMLQKFLKKKCVIVTCYYDTSEKTGHYVIIKNIQKEHIKVIDPTYGPDHTLALSYFKENWHGSKTPRGWFIAFFPNID